MKRFVSFSIVLLLLFTILAGCRTADPSAAADAPTASPVAELPSETATPKPVSESGKTADIDYTLDFAYDAEAQTFSGTLSAEIVNLSDAEWGELCFMDWASADVFTADDHGGVTSITEMSAVQDGVTYSVYWERNEENPCAIWVPLMAALEPMQTVTVTMSITVYVPTVDDRFGVTEESVNLGNAIPTLALYRNGGWVFHPYFWDGESFTNEIADFDFTMTIDPAYTYVCTGAETIDGTTLHTVAENVRDFCLCISDAWQMTESTHNGVLVRSYYTADDTDGGAICLKAAEDALDAFEAAVGDYPYATLDVVGITFWAGGMEYPALVMIDSSLYHDDDEYLAIVVAHEVAHQWFYGLIGNDQYDEAWLDESFASFLEGVYCEHIDMPYDDSYDTSDTMLNVSAGEITADEYVHRMYVAGCSFLKELRERMGDDAFFAALHEIYDTFLYRVADTESVLDIFRAHAPTDISDLISRYFIQ